MRHARKDVAGMPVHFGIAIALSAALCLSGCTTPADVRKARELEESCFARNLDSSAVCADLTRKRREAEAAQESDSDSWWGVVGGLLGADEDDSY